MHAESSLYALLILVSLQFVLVLVTGEKGYKYEITVYDKLETRHSNLSCFHCYNNDGTDCIGMSDIQKIPTRNCLMNEIYCKVRRLHTDGQLTTFDRYCAEECTPGCQEGGLYSECVSCCNHRSFCNMDNSGDTLGHRASSPVLIPILLLILTIVFRLST